MDHPTLLSSRSQLSSRICGSTILSFQRGRKKGVKGREKERAKRVLYLKIFEITAKNVLAVLGNQIACRKKRGGWEEPRESNASSSGKKRRGCIVCERTTIDKRRRKKKRGGRERKRNGMKRKGREGEGDWAEQGEHANRRTGSTGSRGKTMENRGWRRATKIKVSAIGRLLEYSKFYPAALIHSGECFMEIASAADASLFALCPETLRPEFASWVYFARRSGPYLTL